MAMHKVLQPSYTQLGKTRLRVPLTLKKSDCAATGGSSGWRVAKGFFPQEEVLSNDCEYELIVFDGANESIKREYV
jgi:hypothetical protein